MSTDFVVGVAGLGTMGAPMAANMIRHGLRVVVYNRTASRTEPLAGLGGIVAPSPRDLCRIADAVVLMLSGPEAIDAVLFDDPLVASHLSGKTVVNMGTVSPAYSRSIAERLAAAAAGYVEAPVFGSRGPAEQGNLVILSAGDPGLLRPLQAVFDAVGKKTVYCGHVPAGMAAKVATNLLIGAHVESLAETLHFVEKAGVDVPTFMEVVLAGPLASDFYRMKAQKFLKRDFSAQAALARVAETFDYIADTAEATGAAVPVAAVNGELYRRSIAIGLGNEDICAVIKVLESVAVAKV